MTVTRVHARNDYFGTAAERAGLSLPSDAIGTRFWATDSPGLAIWDGDSWETIGSGGSLTVEEQDGAPSVSSVTEIRVNNGRLTDEGGNAVSIDLYDDTDWATAFGTADLADIGAADAEDIGITDSGGYFTATDVEAALQEIATSYLALAGGTLTGNLDITQSDANAKLTITNTTSSANRYPALVMENYSNGYHNGHPLLTWRASGGTQASPATFGQDYVVGEFLAKAHTGTDYRDAGRLAFRTGTNFQESDREGIMYFWLGDGSGGSEVLRVIQTGDMGLGTTAPGQIFDINQGSGNMVADGYDSHSLGEYKKDIQDVGEMLDRLVKAKPKRYKMKIHVSAGELKSFAVEKFGEERWIAEFGGYLDEHGNMYEDDYRQGKMWEMKDKEMQAGIDAEAARLRKERGTEERWTRERLGMIADDPATIEYLPEIVARDYESGAPKGISLVDYIAALHAGLIELNEKVDRGQMMARVEK